MMKSIRPNNAEGAALDWLVAKALNVSVSIVRGGPGDHVKLVRQGNGGGGAVEPRTEWSPSTLWAQGGHLFDDFDIELRKDPTGHFYAEVTIDRLVGVENFGVGYAQNRLLAGNRAVAGFMLGDSCEVPIELLSS